MKWNPFSVDRTAEAIAHLGWGSLSDFEAHALANNDEFYEAVMERVNKINGPRQRPFNFRRAMAEKPADTVTARPVVEELSVAYEPEQTLTARWLVSDGAWAYAAGKTMLPGGLYLANSGKYAAALRELESLLADLNAPERVFQDFFEEYPELVRFDEYSHIIPQASIVPCDHGGETEWRADFVLTPFDQNEFAKILELKPPNFPILKRRTHGHGAFHSRFYAAVQQLLDYGNAFEESATRGRFQEKYGVEIFTPRLELVAGRRWPPQHNRSVFRLQQDRRIELHNWDSYFSKLKRRFGP